MNAADEPSRLCLELIDRLGAVWDDPIVPAWLLDPFVETAEDSWLPIPVDTLPCSG